MSDDPRDWTPCLPPTLRAPVWLFYSFCNNPQVWVVLAHELNKHAHCRMFKMEIYFTKEENLTFR